MNTFDRFEIFIGLFASFELNLILSIKLACLLVGSLSEGHVRIFCCEDYYKFEGRFVIEMFVMAALQMDMIANIVSLKPYFIHIYFAINTFSILHSFRSTIRSYYTPLHIE